MTSLGSLLPLALGAIAIVVVLWVGGEVLARRGRREWTEWATAREIRLEGDFPDYAFEAEWEGVHIRFEQRSHTRAVRGQTSQGHRTHQSRTFHLATAVARAPYSLGDLEVFPAHPLAGLSRPPVRTGDPRFDERFLAYSSEEGNVTRVLTEPVRLAFLASPVPLTIADGAFRWKIDGAVTSPATLDEVLSALARVVRAATAAS